MQYMYFIYYLHTSNLIFYHVPYYIKMQVETPRLTYMFAQTIYLNYDNFANGI